MTMNLNNNSNIITYKSCDKYKENWFTGYKLHKLAYDVISKMLRKYIESGKAYVKLNTGKGADIIIKYGKKIMEIEVKNLSPAWWMSPGWVSDNIITKFKENTEKFLLTTFNHIWNTDTRTRQLLNKNRVKIISTEGRPKGILDKNVRTILYKKLYFIVKHISSYLTKTIRSISASISNNNNIQTNINDFIPINTVIYDNKLIWNRNFDSPDPPQDGATIKTSKWSELVLGGNCNGFC